MGVSKGVGRGKGQGVERPTFPIRFGTYSIRNGRNGGLKSGLRGMSQANMDLSVFQENKLKNHIYTCESSGYKVVAMEEPREHSGGVAIFYRTVEHFSVEAFQAHGAKVISFQLVSGDRLHYARLRM